MNISKKINNASLLENDSWETIQSNIRSGNTDIYNIGETKKVIVDNKEYTVRLVNKTTASWCDDTSKSQTACGFVFEFVEMVTKLKTWEDTTSYSGGYPASIPHGYLADTMFYQLPEDLQSVISETRVISGCGRNYSTNLVSNDKLYLLSAAEYVGTHYYDKASDATRRLDYYTEMQNMGENSNATMTKKNLNGSIGSYWLRNQSPYNNQNFIDVGHDGMMDYIPGMISDVNGYYNALWIAPAFRIA